MPPVFGPLSPSRSRLWSWHGGSTRTLFPSVSASTEASTPESFSSMTIVRPASPKTRRVIMSSTARSASSGVSGTITPLPFANPAALTTYSSSRLSRKAFARSGSWKTRPSAVGIDAPRMSCLLNALSASIWAAFFVGPKTIRRTPLSLRASSSAHPSASGSSGPMTTKSTRFASQNCRRR